MAFCYVQCEPPERCTSMLLGRRNHNHLLHTDVGNGWLFFAQARPVVQGLMRLWVPHPCRHSWPGWMWLWAAWAAGWRPSHSRGVERDEHCGPFQPRPCCDSMIFTRGGKKKAIIFHRLLPPFSHARITQRSFGAARSHPFGKSSMATICAAHREGNCLFFKV